MIILYLWELSNLIDESLVTEYSGTTGVQKTAIFYCGILMVVFEYSHQSNYYTYIASNILFMRSDLIS